VTFREQEAAFLAGVVAGLTTETGRIGFVGGIEIPSVVRFLSGFEAGVASVAPEVTVSTAYVGDFEDTAVAAELATGFFDSGADIVFEVAGAAGLAVYQVAADLGPGHWVVGTDTCKDQLAPDNYLTSATKDVAGAVLRQNRAAAAGEFEGGDITLGLAEDAVGLCEDTYGDLPADVRGLVETAEGAIADGSLVPPGTSEELADFEPQPL
jgi:basic membrane protein A